MTDAEAVWNQLQVPSDLSYSARPHPAEERLWLAIDNQDHRHLLISLGSGTPGHTLLRVRGLSAVVTTLAVAGSPATLWVDVHCEEPNFNGTFATVVDDLVKALAGSTETLATVEEALLAWRWFWGRGRGLSDEAALGLFGELWFLDRWIEGADIRTWHGPTGHRHDFTVAELSVEVKASAVRRDGASHHRITHLDQLADPDTGRLLLFSLQAVRDPNAGNSLPRLIKRLENRYAESAVQSQMLKERLSQAGWSSTQAHDLATTYRVTAEELYHVEGAFPRLTRASFPGGPPIGVEEITYSLDLASCADWRIATNPQQGIGHLGAMRA
jgi:hypothetical protein